MASEVPWSCSKFVLSFMRVDKCSWLNLSFHAGNSYLSARSQLGCLRSRCSREDTSTYRDLGEGGAWQKHCGITGGWGKPVGMRVAVYKVSL